MPRSLKLGFPEGVQVPMDCHWCEVDVSPEDAIYHWRWEPDVRLKAGGKFRCRHRKAKLYDKDYKKKLKADPERYRTAEAKRKAKYEQDAFYYRWKGYRYFDRKFGNGESSLEWLEAHQLMLQPCSYCDLGESGGLDRRDNARPHTKDNVVPCCVECNLILTDMLPEMKDIMASSLREVREKGLFLKWSHPRLRHLK